MLLYEYIKKHFKYRILFFLANFKLQKFKKKIKRIFPLSHPNKANLVGKGDN